MDTSATTPYATQIQTAESRRTSTATSFFIQKKTEVFKFMIRQPVLVNGKPTGKTLTVTWKAEFGYVLADGEIQWCDETHRISTVQARDS